MDSPVSISGLLREERIVVGLKAESYGEAVGQLLDRLDAAGLIGDRAAVDDLVAAEIESGDFPTLGARALLAHYRSDSAKELAVAIGTSPTPFTFAPDKSPDAVFLVLIISPRSAARYYLKTLAGLSSLLRRSDAADSLASAPSAREFLAVVAAQDLVIRPELAVSETIRVMVRYRRRGLPVVSDNGEVLGMVTELEVLRHSLSQVLSESSSSGVEPLQDVEVRDVMQRTVMCLSEDQLISDVLGAVLSEGVAHFPVVTEGKLVGFLSRSDLIDKLLEPATYKQL
jgi:CBS domain-containing protein